MVHTDTLFLTQEIHFRVDDNVLAQFPVETQILSANQLRKSAWTVTAHRHLKLSDGLEERVFFKSASGSHRRTLMEGEFNAMSEIYKWTPDLVPKPLHWPICCHGPRGLFRVP
ncbi:hypothetical protein F4824DRAFT_477962 [Ustulina deusta]|nr:hypothetical protein F4824DRAFT_477962 [Ustulina deusta]